jgi:hypothetical protein
MLPQASLKSGLQDIAAGLAFHVRIDPIPTLALPLKGRETATPSPP